MNQAQIDYEKCKRIARNNTECLSILLKVLGKDRGDILDMIASINHRQYNSITPEGIVSMFRNTCKEDIDKFIETYDKTMDNVDYIRKNYYNAYEKEMGKLDRF